MLSTGIVSSLSSLKNNDIIQTCLHVSETGEAIRCVNRPTFSDDLDEHVHITINAHLKQQ